MRVLLKFAVPALAAVLAFSFDAWAKEYPIGKPEIRNGMEIAAVYLQPVTMDPPGVMRPAADSDIHLEADIHATGDNPNGFAEGEWMPYLYIRYELTKIDGGKKLQGELMPMVASDGPHYGSNVKLAGIGKYKLKLIIVSPGQNPRAHFGRHTDKETGVGPWYKPFEVNFEFTYAGVGKKGAY
jgi:uncharacterized protein involved in high-affinity Fe2+ transport